MSKKKGEECCFTKEECRRIDREGTSAYVKIVNSKKFKERMKKREMEKQANRKAKGKR